ncbi:hypothetical protein ACU4GD_42305 [Cupriavidus basilensis]
MAGVMELGMLRPQRALRDHDSFVGQTVDSELSGNMIDLCPVGALTSKPFRYSARTWELARRKSVSPHDGLGANLVVQTKNQRVMRVLPLDNEAVNECWLSDQGPLLVRRPEQRRPSRPSPLLQARRRVDGNRTGRQRWNTWPMASPAGQARPWRRPDRRAGRPAQHAGRTPPAGPAGAWTGQRQR